MPTHNLSRLSSLDFEELVHDLLEAKWRLSLEAFKTGRDGGIDLRHINAKGGQIIVQCKHYAGSGFSTLLSHLKKDELPKIKVLTPKRYVLVTAVGLTPANKSTIVTALAPYIRSEADVIGASDIERLLRRYPAVEKAHYKLWLTSTAVLERVLHSAEQCQTDFQIDRIRRKLPIFVQNEAFPRALKILEESKLVVISGVPGIGKSTLAEMLIYAHLEKGYEPAVIKSDVTDGRKVFRPDRKMIFYFDDFLGETYLGDRPEYLGKKEDSALVDFIEMIQHSESARFILTTREHILGEALQRSEKLNYSGLADHRCVIELADYRRSQKARILYNHLYFSDLPVEYKQAFLDGDFFLTVIKHENFNPRIIEWMSSFARIKKVAPADYRKHVQQLLDSPEAIWSHAFQQEISTAARSVLIALYTLDGSAELSDLEATWSAFHSYSAKRYNFSTRPNDFRKALKELDGSFLSSQKKWINFLNPSVRDFMALVVLTNPNLLNDILNAAIRFQQIASLWSLSAEDRYQSLREYLTADPALLLSSLQRLLIGPYLRWRNENGHRIGLPVDYSAVGRASSLVRIAEELKSPNSMKLLRAGIDNVVESRSREWIGVPELIGLLMTIKGAGWVSANGGWTMAQEIVAAVIELLPDARALDWLRLFGALDQGLYLGDENHAVIEAAFAAYREEGVSEERYNCDEIESLEDLRETLETLQQRHGHNFEYEIRELDEAIQEKSDKPPVSEDSALDYHDSIKVDSPVDDDDIREMFLVLLD